MADVWGRLTGNAGVCLSTLGPGATNLLTGVADAFLDRAPLVAITGQGGLKRLHHESHQVIDVVQMLEPITKWNSSIRDKSIVPEIVRKAFKVAQQEKPGATHIELPEDIAGQEIEGEVKPLGIHTVRRPSPDGKAVKAAVEIIENSKRPIILAGNGAIRNRSSKALRAFAQKFNIPVACTFMGKGAISDKLPQSLGAVGLGFKDYVIEAFDRADVVFTIGYDIGEYNPSEWNIGTKKRLIHLDFEVAEVYDEYIPEVEIIGDLAEGIHAINDLLEVPKYENWYSDIRQRTIDSIRSYDLKEGDAFNVPGVINTVREIMSDDGLLISDVGSHKMWIARHYRTYCPLGCIISNGLATMGIALPGAVAAKLVNSKREVVAMMGDGGALMNIQELETAKRLGIGATFIIFNDNNYGLITWKQNMSKGSSFGTELGNPDFAMLAESFGIKGYKPTSLSELKKTLTHTIKTDELAVIEIAIETAVNDQLIDELESYYKK